MKNKFRGLRIKEKILILNIVLFVIPCLILFTVLFRLLQKEGNEQLNESRLVILRQMDEKMEDIFSEIVSYSNYFTCNADINKIISRDEFQSPYKAMKAQQAVREYFKNSRIIYSNLEYDIQILCTNGNNYSSADTGEAKVLFPDIEKLKKESWYEALKDKDSAIHYIPTYQSQEFKDKIKECGAVAVKTVKNLNSGRIVGLMEVDLKNSLFEELFQSGAHNENQDFFIMDENGIIINSTNQNFVNQKIESEAYMKNLQDNMYGYFKARAGGSGLLCDKQYNRVEAGYV